MHRLIFLLVFCPLLAVPILLYGCGDAGKARLDVGKKKVQDQIDEALGKLDVQKAEIDNGIRSAKQALEGVRKAKYKDQASLDQLDDKVKPHEEKIGKCDESLARLRDAIKADRPADFGGKTYSMAELKDMAGKILQTRKDAEEQIKGFDKARDNIRTVVATITKQQQELETRIAKLQAANTKLDAEMAAAKSMKDASARMGDANNSLSENLDELDRKIAALSGEVRADLAGESEKWGDGKADKAIGDVDAFLKASQTPSYPVAEIDRVLGPAKK